MMKLLPIILLLLSLVIFASGGCTKNEDMDQPPTNRDGVSDGREDRGEDRGDAQEPSRPPSAPQGDIGRNEYTIQVGIFDRAEAADQLSYELRTQRISNFIQRVGKRWRVCVGRYYSRSRAERTLQILYDKGYTKAVVIAPESAKSEKY